MEIAIFGLWLGITFSFLGWLRAKFEKDAFEGDEVIYISRASTTLTSGNSRQRTQGFILILEYWQRLQDPHPMIVILRPSNNALKRELCWTNRLRIRYFIGVFQLFWICFLSFLFSSTIGGTFFFTLCMVVVFITIVGLSRGISILACWLPQKYLNLKVIEYDNLQEKKMVQRLLGGLPGVLMDIRWVRYKKTHWQESVKMYRWGHQLSRGNVMEVPNNTEQCTQTQYRDTPTGLLMGILKTLFGGGNVVEVPGDTEQCTLHTHNQLCDATIDQIMRVAGVIVFLLTPSPTPWGLSKVFDALPFDESVDLVTYILVVTAPFLCLCLGRTSRLLICNCGVRE